MKQILITFLFSFSFCSIFSQENAPAYSINYDYRVTRVQNLNKNTPMPEVFSNIFGDEILGLKLIASSDNIFDFTINNNSKDTLFIDWNKAFFVNEEDQISPLITIGRSIDDKGYYLLPNENITNSLYSDTSNITPYEYTSYATAELSEKAYNHIRQKQVSLILPFTVNGEASRIVVDLATENVILTTNLKLCNIMVNELLGEEMKYIGGGKYSIGSYRFHYKDERFHCFLQESGNAHLVDMLKTSRRSRTFSKIFTPIGAVVLGGGLLSLANDSEMNITTGICLIGGTILFSSIALRKKSNQLLINLPKYYTPHTQDLTLNIGANPNGLGLTLNF